MDSRGLPNVHHSFRGKTSPLPPIICERDRRALKEVQDYVKHELKKMEHTVTGPDDHRYWIYSTAFNMLIQNVTVYKDILSDIKREYEDCITALKNGQREAKFLQVRIKTLTSLPTTINGYRRRQKELEEKLVILRADNQRLENTLNQILKAEEEETRDEDVIIVIEETKKIEKRPVPGLPVVDWTDEKTMTTANESLDKMIEELNRQKKASYVHQDRKMEMHNVFRERMEQKEKLAEECKRLKKRHNILKMANEAVQEYRQLPKEKREEENLSEFILRKLSIASSRRKSSASGILQAGFDDDDPAREKEAEMILEYIEKFNELFYDEEYAKAAIHAANSPRGVLRAVETLLRFKEASENFVGTPTPLLMYAEAFMYSSTAQSHIADDEMSYECVKCALSENRSDMVLYWVAQGCVTSCKKVADLLSAYAEARSQHREVCFAAAQKMYSEAEGCQVLAASHMYKLKQVAGMLDYTHSEKFTQETYFELIKECMDENLVWILSQTSAEEYGEEGQQYSDYQSPLPIPLSHALMPLLNMEDEGKKVAVKLLDEIYNGKRRDDIGQEDEGPLPMSDLSRIIYEDGEDAYDNDGLVKERWKALARECENQNMIELGMDIRAAIVVRNAIIRALSVIAEDEKEEFDYYR